MQTTLEQVIQAVRQLSPEEIQQLGEWIKEQQRASETQAQREEDVRKRRMEWLKANREQYGGQYVVLDGDKLLGVAVNYAEGRRIAREAGVAEAFVDYLSKPDEEGFMGGW